MSEKSEKTVNGDGNASDTAPQAPAPTPATSAPADTPAYSPTYATIITAGDFGPWISKLVLALPCEVGPNDVSPQTFNVFCARRETADGSPIMNMDGTTAQGYLPVAAAYPCQPNGTPAPRGTHAALELPEAPLTKTIEGSALGHSRFVENRFRVTQLEAIPGPGGPVTGLVFEEWSDSACPEVAGWYADGMSEPVDGIQLEYAYYEPSFEPSIDLFGQPHEKPEKAAVIVWLHGAGEGGDDLDLALLGNRVTALSQDPIQGYFGGAAWVVVPQAPTYWMDDGAEQMGRSNQSIYAKPLKALIDEFVTERADRVDPGRIIIGGLSNGGFMTVRMCADHPDYFAAGIPVCAPFYAENQTPEVVGTLSQTPLWFVHSKDDPVVDPRDTALPLHHALKEAGAEVHMTYFEHVDDLTGRYREPDGRPLRSIGHFSWIQVFNDFCRTDLDGTNVMVDGEPAGVWEWAASKHRE